MGSPPSPPAALAPEAVPAEAPVPAEAMGGANNASSATSAGPGCLASLLGEDSSSSSLVDGAQFATAGGGVRVASGAEAAPWASFDAPSSLSVEDSSGILVDSAPCATAGAGTCVASGVEAASWASFDAPSSLPVEARPVVDRSWVADFDPLFQPGSAGAGADGAAVRPQGAAITTQPQAKDGGPDLALIWPPEPGEPPLAS